VVEVEPEWFEQMVGDALDKLPEEFGRLLSNVSVMVDLDGGPPGLLGLYEGVPLTKRGTAYGLVAPDVITIYRQAICAVCQTEQQVADQVRRTVIHEIGHYFGLNDARLHELGW
jgi:predicted Zn-dependent protease with MMP-like domain